MRHEPESVPFRSPVDPQALGIPDYFEIVKRPMDLGTIRNNLMSGKYSDPWQYVDDVWLMFDNAWLYNRKTSRVYRYCTKVSQRLLCSVFVLIFKFIFLYNSSPKFLNKKSILSCRLWAIAAVANTLLIHKYCAVMANNFAPFHVMLNITAIKIGMFSSIVYHYFKNPNRIFIIEIAKKKIEFIMGI